MEDKYWEQFMITGAVRDYLCYKGGTFGTGNMEQYMNVVQGSENDLSESKGQSSESANGYRNDTIIGSYR